MQGEQQLDEAAEVVDQAAAERSAQQLEKLAALIRQRAPRRVDVHLTNEIVEVPGDGRWREHAFTGGREVVVEIEWGPGE